MDSYLEKQWDIGRDVSDMLRRANRYARLAAFDHRGDQVGGDWNYTIDLLNRMRQVLDGREDVDVPAWRRRSPDWEEHSRPGYRQDN